MSHDLDSQKNSSGRVRKKRRHFDEDLEILEKKESASREEQRQSAQARMQRANMDDEAISPSTPTPAQRGPLIIQPRIAGPSSTTTHIPSPAGSNMPWDPKSGPQKGTSGRKISGNKAADTTPARVPVSSGPASLKSESHKRKRSSSPAGRRVIQAAGCHDSDTAEGRPQRDSAINTPVTEETQGRARPTGWAPDGHGMMIPLYGHEVQAPNGVLKHLSNVPGIQGPWRQYGGSSSNPLARKGKDLGKLTELERAAGVGRNPIDDMATSEEEEEDSDEDQEL
ncbi:hypothetical protein LTR97_005320 [Elasticomyces elasticus]|uniref:Uncharacterized protein n=1 Tax=Elasticomyces elasticus TaxID=574655 RepID=A0AAN7W9Z3_9PEZI|nr:hypothetical protein LTR97_005320 [Elasticomyces elasticus]